MTRTKLQRLLNKLDGKSEATAKVIADFDASVKTLRDKLAEDISAATLSEVNQKINKLRKSINLDPLLGQVEDLQREFRNHALATLKEIEEKSQEFRKFSEEGDEILHGRTDKIEEENKVVRTAFTKLKVSTEDGLSEVKDSIASLNENLPLFAEKEGVDQTIKEVREEIKEGDEESIKYTDKVKKDLLNRLNEKGGGNANRNIAIGGNVSVLSKYTDINLKAGNNVTITYVQNNTTKYTDVTISATGGGSSVGGTIRSINNVSTSQTMGSVAGTDYVYLAGAGIKLDLPPATGNTNLYTVKNVSNSSILIAGTIDDDVSGIIMPIKYTSVDLISNDTSFNIT